MNKHFYIVTFFFLSLELLLAQEKFLIVDQLRKYDLNIDQSEYDNHDTFTRQMITWQVDFLKKFDINDSTLSIIDIERKTRSKTLFGRFLYHINLGDYLFYKFKDKKIEARNSYLTALDIAKSNKHSQLTCEAIKRLLKLNKLNYLIDNTSSKIYLETYKKNAYDNIEMTYYKYYKLILEFQYFKEENWDKDVALQLLEFTKKNKDNYLNGIIFQLISSYHNLLNQNSLAIEYENKAITSFERIIHNYKSTDLKTSYIALARYNLSINKTSEASNSLSKINSKTYNTLEEDHEKYIFFYNSIIDSTNKNYKSAFKNLIEYTFRAEESLLSNNKNAYDNLETKYQTTEKEKKIVQLLNTNLKTEAKRIKNRNLLIGSLVLLLFGAVTAFLTYKNTKRKQRIAEQEREIEIQKTEKLLKDQELTAIDAMISGQEKERQRLANDLHDNLGSTLATIKLHFDHLKNNRNNPKVENIEELYSKTNNLLDEAYQKVRTIAHEKNSGVMAKQGLLPAIKNLVKKASNGDQLHIEVQDYGLDERLDNTLEISIFRMIQELITNTIKHANASEIHISLTNHDSLLNIIVEDNGKGFNAKILPEKDGMGLKSIEKRIEHMEGTFEIDSTIGKGTNIIINIPI